LEKNIRGLVHITGSKKMSMYELAQRTTPDVGEMTMTDADLPLTVDMSLKSNRIKPYTLKSK